MDLAAGSIREAKKSEQPRLRFLRHDMRMPFGRNTFDYVFNFFTSFGYFDGPAEHMAVVRNMAASLQNGGAAGARLPERPPRGIQSHPTRRQGNRRRDLSADALDRRRHFFKRIVVETGADAPLEYIERVAKFTLRDFERMFTAHDLSIEEVHGDYRLNAYDRHDLAADDSRGEEERNRQPSADYFRERLLRMRLSVSGETPRYDASIH